MRAVICVMMFTACWTSYTARLQMPILMVKMINVEGKNNSSYSESTPSSNVVKRDIFDLTSGTTYDYGSSSKFIRGSI